MNSVWKMMLLANGKEKDNAKENIDYYSKHRYDEYDDDFTGYGKRDYYGEYKKHEKNGKHKEKTEFDRSVAEEWVVSMENADGTEGEHWTYEQTEAVRKQHGFGCDSVDFYAAINMMYSDYCKVAKEYNLNTTDFYAKMANAFICDKDAEKDKVSRYFECIVK